MPDIDSRTVTGLRAAFAACRHDQVKGLLSTAKISLAAVLELAVWSADTSNYDVVGKSIIAGLAPSIIPSVKGILSACNPTSILLNGDGLCEVSVVSELTAQDVRWWDFVSRFRAQLLEGGYEKKYAWALAGCLHEMADNVCDHAAIGMPNKTTALAGWHVVNGVAAFAVSDLGCGIKKSLNSCEKWKHVASDNEALLRVVKDSATRKEQNVYGDGYRTVVQNFVSRNGCLAVRSGSAELIAVGDIVEGAIVSKPCPMFRGTSVAAWCAPRASKLPNEPFI